MSESSQETFPDVREWSESPPNVWDCSDSTVGRPSRLFGSGRETLPNVRDALLYYREWSEGPFGFPIVVGRPSLMSGRGPETLPDDREWSGGPPNVPEWLGVSPGSLGGPPDVRQLSGDPPDCPGVVGVPPGCLGVVGRLSWMSLIGGRPFRMSGSCREALPNVREALPVVPEWSGDTPRCPGVVRRPSRLFGSGRETLQNVRNAPPNIREWSEALSDVQEWSGGPFGCPGVVARPFRMFGRGREALPDVREWLEGYTGYL